MEDFDYDPQHDKTLREHPEHDQFAGGVLSRSPWIEEDFSLRAVLDRHPRIVAGTAVVIAAIAAFPVIDWAWKTLLGLH